MQKNRQIGIRTDKRAEPDIRKLTRALLALAQAQAEKEAETEHRAATEAKPAKRTPRRSA